VCVCGVGCHWDGDRGGVGVMVFFGGAGFWFLPRRLGGEAYLPIYIPMGIAMEVA